MKDQTNSTNKRSAPPGRDFSFPHEVLENPGLSLADKRAVLCEWASDACAMESFPLLRWLPGTNFPVTFSSIIDALYQLDRQCRAKKSTVRMQQTSRNKVVFLPGVFSGHSSAGGKKTWW